MADLGTLTVADITHHQPDHLLVGTYRIHRGIHLGGIGVFVPPVKTPVLHAVTNYIVRQIRIIYRQLWPAHGQRFPQ